MEEIEYKAILIYLSSNEGAIKNKYCNYSNLTERKTSKGMRRINSEANFTNFNIK